MEVAQEETRPPGGRNLEDLSREELLQVLTHIRDKGGKGEAHDAPQAPVGS